MESYVILVLGWIVFFAFHSFLASDRLKSVLGKPQKYRLIYNIFSALALLVLLFYMMVIPAELVLPKNIYTKFFGLVLATYGIMILKASSKIYDWKAFFGFGDVPSEKPELKKEGILAHIRHPLYLGLILMFSGYFFFSPTLTNLVAWACTMLYLPFGIASEEKKLVREFGEAYTNYQKEVPMLIPKKKFLKRKK